MSGLCDCDCCDHDFDGVEETQTFVGKYFLLIAPYWDDRGMWREGYAGKVKAPVGGNCYLIQTCKAGFKQHVVPTAFFIEARALIFDTFDELREAKEERYTTK